MDPTVDSPPAPGVPIESERFRLARVAHEAALAVPGVLATDAGPEGRFVTVNGPSRLEGVTCIATKGGGYEVSLRLVCGLVPLHRLGDQVRAAVSTRAAAAALPVDSVNVHVAAVAESLAALAESLVV